MWIVLEESFQHKLKTNNSNSQVPWQSRIIDQEFIMVFTKGATSDERRRDSCYDANYIKSWDWKLIGGILGVV